MGCPVLFKAYSTTVLSFCPAVFFGHLQVEFALELVFAFLKNDDIVPPSNFSHQRREKLILPVCQIAVTHSPKVTSTVAPAPIPPNNSNPFAGDKSS